MVAIAKLFKNGQSQAIRLPKEFRFENQNEVILKHTLNGLLILPKKNNIWDEFYLNLDNFSDDFLENREELSQNREELF